MNRKESTFSTTGSSSENKEELRIKSDKSIALLKLVYQERKSIKQSAKYLKINYNSAKRIVKNFRKGRIPSGESDFGKLIDELKERKDSNQNQDPGDTKSPLYTPCEDHSKKFSEVQKKILIYNHHLERLNYEIRQNQMTLIFLTNLAYGVYQSYQSVNRGSSV
jgi:hypothetical protein